VDEFAVTYAGRRLRNVLIATIAAAFLAVSVAVYDTTLHQGEFYSGWLLVAVMAVLTIYGLRRKLTMLPVGRNAAWLQVHVYGGWITVLLFALHIGWRIPQGWFEISLAALFVLVAGSGIVGTIFSKGIPKELTRRGEEVIFERIPGFISELRREAEDLVLASVQETNSTTIHDLYAGHLRSYFGGPKNFFQHLTNSGRGIFTLMTEFDARKRYLNTKEDEFAEQLRALVVKKDDLDFHYALQAALKGWLFVHVPLITSLWIMAILHLVMVYAFSGGIG